jgi:hypothetical protein
VGLALAVAAGCGDDKLKACTVGDASSCSGGKVCEAYTDGSGAHAACFAPTLLSGKVTDSTSHAPIAGARVVALDGDSHAATGTVSTTDAMGNYSVRVIAVRMASVSKSFTLRVSASRYLDFPSGIRVALPITVSYGAPTAAATVTGPEDVALSPIAQPPAGAIAGTVTGAHASGVLVVAASTGQALSAVTDASGSYVIFNVPDGNYAVSGYFVGANYQAASGVVVAGALKSGVDLAQTGSATGVLTGSLSYVAGAPTAQMTAVVLRLISTHEVPPGLEVPAGNSTPYSLEGVPDGSYEVLAAFPNDGLVKDPDPGQGGTATPTVTFNGGGTQDVGSFKITDPVAITGPDADQSVTGTPNFGWTAYPSTDHYRVDVFDSEGNLIWSQDNITGTSLAYGGSTQLVSGDFYQWRITAFHVSNQAPRPISESEDLRGVWQQE